MKILKNYRPSSIEFDNCCFICLEAVMFGGYNTLKCKLSQKKVRCDYVCNYFKNYMAYKPPGSVTKKSFEILGETITALPPTPE